MSFILAEDLFARGKTIYLLRAEVIDTVWMKLEVQADLEIYFLCY